MYISRAVLHKQPHRCGRVWEEQPSVTSHILKDHNNNKWAHGGTAILPF